MPEPIPVTDELLAAWRAFYDDGKSAPMRDPRPDDWTDQATLAGIKRVIEIVRANPSEKP